ncbi:unnamed protein product [Symbiodinium sp. KB8]|nr:unnamed protein product [Symbiodinium sp. KB8]
MEERQRPLKKAREIEALKQMKRKEQEANFTYATDKSGEYKYYTEGGSICKESYATKEKAWYGWDYTYKYEKGKGKEEYEKKCFCGSAAKMMMKSTCYGEHTVQFAGDFEALPGLLRALGMQVLMRFAAVFYGGSIFGVGGSGYLKLVPSGDITFRDFCDAQCFADKVVAEPPMLPPGTFWTLGEKGGCTEYRVGKFARFVEQERHKGVRQQYHHVSFGALLLRAIRLAKCDPEVLWEDFAREEKADAALWLSFLGLDLKTVPAVQQDLVKRAKQCIGSQHEWSFGTVVACLNPPEPTLL